MATALNSASSVPVETQCRPAEDSQSAAVHAVSVRPATFSDYEAVMDIDRNLFQGLDYLPSMFYQFLHRKQHFLYVGELDGKVVSFQRILMHSFIAATVIIFP